MHRLQVVCSCLDKVKKQTIYKYTRVTHNLYGLYLQRD